MDEIVRDERPAAVAQTASDWLVLGALGYRACSGLVAALGFALTVGLDADRPVVLVALLVCLVDVVAMNRLQRAPFVGASTLRLWALVDAAVLVLLNLWSAQAVSGSLAAPFHFVLWNQVLGIVVIWYALYGISAATGVFLAGVPLVLAMMQVNDRVPDGDVLPTLVTHVMWLGLALIAAMVVKVLLDNRGMAAMSEGVEAGQQLQQLRHLREVHDTVLQTLESVALCATATQLDEKQRLAIVAEAARGEASRLRENIRRVEQDLRDGLERQLRECVDGFRERGLRVELDSLPSPDRRPLSPTVCRALRDATFEALTNVVKHAQAQHVRVGLVHDGDGVEVVIEDDGRGFDTRRTLQGFGITHSIRGRLVEVGGSVRIVTLPGEGTRVVLRVGRPGRA